MDRTVYSIRPFADPDFEAEARIDREIHPQDAPTPEELRHWDQMLHLDPTHLNVKIAAELRATGEIVGYGSLAQPSFNYDPLWFWIWVAVAPAHRRNGIGAELYAQLEEEAKSRNGLGFWAGTREEDLPGVRFLTQRGFRTHRKIWESRLDLAQLDLSAVPDRSAALEQEGFRFSTLAEEAAAAPETRRRVYRLSEATGADAPRLGNYHPFSFEEFGALYFEPPLSMPEGLFLAWIDQEVVGMSCLQRDLARPDTLRVGWTGTHPQYRGRGIGTELKRRAALFARQRGFRFLMTGNDSRNRTMLAINQRFGFRPETVWIQGEMAFAAPGIAP